MDQFQNIDTYLDNYAQKLIDFLPSIFAALVLLIVGLWIIKITIKLTRRIFEKRALDETLKKFLLDLISWLLKIVLFITVIAQLGIQTSSFVAIVGAAGLAVGLALQGSLANFAGGVLIMLFKPYKVGHFIEAQGVAGVVKEITIFTTKLNTFGNQLVIIPNGKLSNDHITNFTEEGMRREAITFGISYDCDIKLTKNILLDLVMEQDLVLKLEDKMPMVAVLELADSAVNLTLRYWVKNEDYWNVRFYTLEEGKKRLEEAGIVIPFPQRDIHLHNTADKIS
ncbi:MAG: mechanosensitive ion channel [Altibacter sp.]|uniref:mechanosensitive ion channel family protein n=1 Tax=Altibacter sp. TaxID=2024823 RepID=UPI001DFCB1A8|nr:mechanosensitive ion channel domain-containing protein [Altibacter sp.]MBZ0326375.1 mechanosensitive ion channel [Altibacter sp.]